MKNIYITKKINTLNISGYTRNETSKVCTETHSTTSTTSLHTHLKQGSDPIALQIRLNPGLLRRRHGDQEDTAAAP